MNTILLTGAAGIVGTLLRPFLAKRYPKILLTDIAELSDPAANESFEQGDITDLEFVKALTKNADGIIHLAGKVGPNFTLEEVLGPNIVGTNNVFEAARTNGISRVVYASSAHCVGFIKRGEHIDHRTFPRPNGEYAVSKAFGEMAASHYADKFGLNILTIRIGYVGNGLDKERRIRNWVSPRDLVQLIEIGLNNDLGFEITYGISDNPDPFFDNANAFRLGYQPQDNAVDFVTDPSVLDQKPDLTTIEEGVVGGGFAAAGFAGDPNRIL
jgi:uronate dehydrogenase